MVLAGGFAASALANDEVMALQNDPANNVMPNITYNGWNYSALDQINLDNVQNLQVAKSGWLNSLRPPS